MAPMKRPAAPMKRPATAAATPSAKRQRQVPDKLPVSTLCGFLGAGKTTLLKHILERKRADDKDGFKCAVVVNDVAEINIDKSLIDQSALVQSDGVIALQNGCICCTLQNDLVTQITNLAKKKTFDYMIIEASGVSEPSQIAKLFADCEEDHDHHAEHAGHANGLSQLSKLDTCATVVDASDFFNKFEMIKLGPKCESFPKLLIEQIEYANVVILNKTDLVSKTQLLKVSEQIAILNPKAKLLTARNSKIDVAEVVDSGLYNAGDFAHLHDIEPEQEEEVKDCCKESMLKGGMPCCRSKRTRDSGKSKVILGYTGAKTDSSGKTMTSRHTSRFGITSFLYQSRRPFHPQRFIQNFVGQFFIMQAQGSDDDNDEGKGKRKSLQERKKEERQRDTAVKKQQAAADGKQKHRTEKFGDLFRSKGFVWLANSHDAQGVMSQANNVMTLDFSDWWVALQEKTWTGSEEEKAAARKNWMEPYGDRRQDLVFIGKNLNDTVIQEKLDECLLTDEEMAIGLDGWKAIFW